MRNATKQWIEELTIAIDYLIFHEPWLSWKAIREEVQGYYDCSNSDFSRAAKIAEKKYNG